MHELLDAHSLAVGLPVSYHSDISIDAETISRYPEGTEFAWLLKNAGTVIMPLYSGASPNTVEFWLNQVGRMRCFHIKGETITEVTRRKLKHLVNQVPKDLSEDGVNRILAMRHWGMFHPPELPAEKSAWTQWREWFLHHQHDLMASYLEKAIRLQEKAA